MHKVLAMWALFWRRSAANCRHSCLAVITPFQQNALLASWPGGFAGFSAVFDEQHVEGIALVGFDCVGEQIVRLFECRLGADEAHARGDAVDVGVDGEEGHAEGEEEGAVGGLGAYAGEVAEVGEGVGGQVVLEELEADFSVLLADLFEDGLDARGFGVGEAADADGALELVDGGVGDLVPGFEGSAEDAVTGLTVRVGGVLGEDGFNQDGDSFSPGAQGAGAVGLFESPQDFAHQGGRGSDHLHREHDIGDAT
jgi:hypothetical protein